MENNFDNIDNIDNFDNKGKRSKRMKKLMVMMVAVCAVMAAQMASADEAADVRFGGGHFDGWDREVTAKSAGLGGALVTLSSGEVQMFDFTAAPLLAEVVIEAEEPQGTITNGGVIRLSVPAAWACRFNGDAVVIVASNAAAKVGVPYYCDEGRTLAIPVIEDFVDGDVLSVAGLQLSSLRLVQPGSGALELDFDGDGERDAYDIYALGVRASWPGGFFDGWDGEMLALSAELTPPVRGTVIRLQ